MKKTEKILVTITLLGVVLRFLLIPGASELITVGATVLAILYGYFSFALLNDIRLRQIFKKTSYTNLSWKRILISVLIGFSISTIVFGILFKLLILPGAYELLIIGLVGTGFLIVIIFLVPKMKNESYRKIYIRCVPIVVLGLTLYLVSTEFLIRTLYRENPSFVKAAIESIHNPNNLELEAKMNEEWDKIHLSSE